MKAPDLAALRREMERHRCDLDDYAASLPANSPERVALEIVEVSLADTIHRVRWVERRFPLRHLCEMPGIIFCDRPCPDACPRVQRARGTGR